MVSIRTEIYSPLLGLATSVMVLVPDGLDPRTVPVVTLLHGLSDNSTVWERRTNVEEYAQKRGVAVVMPEVGRSWYTDMAQGLKYFTFITEELPAECHRLFGLSREREKNFIMGNSMGGYGAMKCAFRKPENYAGVGAFSSVADITDRVERARGTEMEGEFRAIFGQELTIAPEEEIFSLVRGLTSPLPRIYMACGEQDALYEGNVRLDETLTALSLPHRFDHRPGLHCWPFWNESLEDAFSYFFD